MDDADVKLPSTGALGKAARTALQLGGAIPGIGAFLAAAASSWSEFEQDKVNSFFKHWLKMLEDEIREQAQTLLEIMARLDLTDEEVVNRIESKEYQSLLRKAFRDWAGAESEQKREWVRNILSNAAASRIASDDVVRLFIEWMKKYSELHFYVIGAVYNSNGISRRRIWLKLGKQITRDDSPDAGLYRLLIRDLTMGGIIRQHRQKNYDGSFLTKTPTKRNSGNSGPRAMESAFDDEDGYELSELGQQFVHYAMTELPPKIDVTSSASETPEQTA